MGDMADAIINGLFDEQTGEFIDDEHSHMGGPGYPRTMEPGHYNSMYNRRKSRPGISPTYNTIKQLLSVNPIAKSQCNNKNATITFIHKFYKANDIKKKRYNSFKYYKDVVKEHKKKFKDFIKEYK